MKTKAVRLYCKNDLRLEEFDLPEIKEDEILAHIISNSICMSSHKAAIQGTEHKRIPNDINKNPIIIGHEFCGEIIEVGLKWKNKFQTGDKFSIQPALNIKEDPFIAPGYSYQYFNTKTSTLNEAMAKKAKIASGYASFRNSLHRFRSIASRSLKNLENTMTT